MKTYHNIIFDFDGTLLKSDPGIADSMIKTLRHFGIEETDYEKLKRFIGPPMRVTFPEEYGFDAETTEKAVGIYRGYYNDAGMYMGELYTGAPQLLKALRERGRFLALATAKVEIYLPGILRHFGLEGMLDVVVGADLEGKRAHKSEIFSYAMDTYRIRSGDAVVVGDSRYDILAAHELGLPCVAVTWGYASLEEIEKAGPDATVNTMEELQALLLGDAV